MNTKYQQRAVRIALLTALAIGGAALTTQSFAGTATSSLGVSATVINSCSISTASDVAFGNYDPISGTDNTNTGSFTVTCTPSASTAITLGQGSNADTGSTDAAPLRRMTDGSSDYLSYNLYTDNTYATVWDNSTGVSYTGTGSADTVTVYAKAAAGQLTAPAGSYTDTVVATITF